MATPMLAVTAISCTTCTGISRMVMKPTRSASSAMMAGISNCRKVWRAASMRRQARHRGFLDRADLLHAMRHADRENQERHQQSERIDAVTQQHQRAELPDHRDDGADDGHHRHLERLHVVPDRQQRQQDGDDGEDDHGRGAVGDVADHLGEADHVHVDGRSLSAAAPAPVVLDLVAHARLERVRHLDGIDGPAGGVLLQHDGRDQRAGEIVGHQTAADAGLEDVLAHVSSASGVGTNSESTTLPASMPPSTTSM